MKVLKIDPYNPDIGLINEAGAVLRNGGLVAFPTETVYGIGANYLNKKTIDRLYEIKQRPKDKPFTIHISKFEALKDLEIELEEYAKRTAYKFWPGPLTILTFNKRNEKLGIRMPSNKIALQLIDAVNFPIVAPSANLSGGKPAVSGSEVASQMKDKVDLILDGGRVELGIESTVLDVTTMPYTVVREGAIPKREVLALYHVLFVCTGNSCRSVMAKFFLEKFLKDSGLSEKIYVDSAGTSSFSAMQASPNTIDVMKEEGIDVSSHIGKNIREDLLKKSDFIFIMGKIHMDIIRDRFPQYVSKVQLFKENEEIQDPIGKTLEDYKRVRDIIKEEVTNIFLELFKEREI